jgi:hypothetical protein
MKRIAGYACYFGISFPLKFHLITRICRPNADFGTRQKRGRTSQREKDAAACEIRNPLLRTPLNCLHHQAFS